MRLIAALLAIYLVAGQGDSASITYKSGVRRELCSWGAQYWCSGTKTATLCGKTEWCTNNYWQHQVISDPSCSIVHDLIKHARKTLATSDEGPTTDYETAMFIARGCSLLKEENSRQLCRTIVTSHEHLPKLVELIDSKLPVQSVAEAVGVCKRQLPAETTQLKEEPQEVEEEPCITCEDVVTVTQKHAHRHLSLDVYKKMVRSQCDKLGSASKSCHDMAMKQYKEFYRRFVGVNPSTVCKAQKQCVSKKGRLSPVQTKNEVCATCEMVIEDIRTMDRDANVQAAIRGLVNETCKYLGQFEKLCMRMVNEGLEYVFEIIATELEPEVICEELNLCSGDSLKTAKKPVANEQVSLTGVKCTVCEFMMREVDKMILSNKTEEAILNILDQVCTRLPPSIAGQCESILDQYKGQIIKILAAELDPKNVCTFLGICTQEVQAAATKEKQSDDPDCAICEFVVQVIDDVLMANETEEALEKLLDHICERLPKNVRRDCERFVGIYSPQILALLVSNMRAEQICILLKLCPAIPNNAALKVQPKETVKEDDILCELCNYVVTYIDLYLQRNATEEEIEKFLDQICTRLPAEVTDTCENLVKQYGPTLVKFLVSGLDPTLACKSVGLCDKESETVKQENSVTCEVCQYVVSYIDHTLVKNATEEEIEKYLDKVCSLLPAAFTNECDTLVQEYGPILVKLLAQGLNPSQVCKAIGLCKSQLETVKQENSVTCEVCQYVVSYIDQTLVKNATEEEIEKYLDKVCSLLPAAFTNECDALVQEYGPILVKLLAQGLNPSQVCKAIGLCKSQLETVKQENSVTCEVCQYVVSYIDHTLVKNATEEEIEKYLDKVCSLLPAAFTNECDALVQEYGPILVKLLAQGLNPSQVCKAIGLCNSQLETVKQENSVTCEVCQYVVSYIDQTLEKNATEEEIEKFLDRVCSLLPSALTSECDALIQEYGPMLVKLLVEGLNPTEVCKAIGLCTSQLASKKEADSDVACVVCETVMHQLDSLIGEKATAAEVEAGLDRVCGLVPKSVQAKCTAFVEEYTPFILQVVAAEISPKEVCSLLKLCPKSNSVKAQSKAVNKEVKDDECTVCKLVVSALDSLLKANATKEDVTAALEKVCTFLPEGLRPQCDSFVSEYASYVVDIIVSDLKPDAVCEKLGLCSSKKEVHPVLKEVKGKVGDEICEVCVLTFTVLENLLPQNATEEVIIKTLREQVCDRLPTQMKNQCKDMVQIYLHYIIDLVIQELPPNKICSSIGLCSNSSSSKLTALSKATKLKSEPGPICIECEVLLSELQRDLKNPDFEKTAEAKLFSLCAKLPQSSAALCRQLVHQDLPFVLQLLSAYEPDDLCALIDLCGKSAPKIVTTPVKGGPQCTICEFIMTELDNNLADNATKQQIEEALEQVCNFLPASVKQPCDSFVTQYTPELIQYLLQLKPAQVCTYLGFCNSSSTLKREVTAPVRDGPQCTICEFIMTELDNTLANNATKQQIEQALEQVCNFLPASIKEQCDGFVTQYTPQLIQLLLQLKPAQVCTYLGLCTSTSTLKLKAGPQCVLCEFVMTQLDNILASNATEQQIEQALDAVCNFLPTSVKAQCEDFVHQYTPVLIQLLLRFKPQEVCTRLGLCNSTKLEVKRPENAGPQCTICEFILTALDSLLAANATKEQIEKALDQVCNFLPASVKQECDAFVQQYAPQIIQLLLQIAPDQVCSFLGLCSEKYTALETSPVKAGPVCVLCEFVMTQLDNMLSKNASKEEIEQALDRVCNLLPASIKRECDAFIQQYTPELIQLLLQVAPSQVCSFLGVCSAELKSLETSPVKAGPVCVLCELVMKQLDHMLSKNASKEEIEQALDRVCDLLPASFKSECVAFIQQYTPELIQLLLQVAPSQVCSYLGVCSAGLKSLETSPVKAGPVCVLCELVMKQLDHMLSKNASKEEIEQALDQVCDLLPASFKSECVAFIQQYTPELIQLLLQVAPSQVCSYLGVCSAGLKLKAGPTCVLCEFVMTQLEKILATNATEQQIEQALDRVCDLLPANVKQQCDGFVKQYTGTLIQLLLQVTPDKACTFLKLCTTKDTGSRKVQGHIQEAVQCSLCKFVMGALDKMLGDNATQTQIEQALEAVCDALPEDIRPECHQFMAEYIPRLLDILLTYKPENVCEALAICTKKESVVAAAPKRVQASATCVVCEAVMKEFENVVGTDVTKEKIKAFIDQACNLVPSDLKGQCDQLVATFTPQILDLLLEIQPSQYCAAIRVCLSSSALGSKNTQAGPQCAICEFAMSQLDEILTENATESQIEEALGKVCSLLPERVRPECDAFVKQYSPELIQLLLKYKPQQVCTYLGFCSSDASASRKVQAGPSCIICEYVMRQLDQILADNATEQQIAQALDTVCSLLPASVKSECDAFVEQYTPELIQLLLKYKADQVCTYLGLCSAHTTVSNKKVNDDACTICEFAMTELDNILADNATKMEAYSNLQEQIEQALSQVCTVLPDDIQKQCNDFVKQYFDELVLIVLQYKPQQICALLGLCPTANSANVVSKPNIGCIICDFVMVQLDEIMTENTTQEKIREILDLACTALPHEDWKTECTEFVDKYTAEIVELLLLLKPEEICIKLKLCPDNTAVQTKKVADGPQCALCEFVVTELDNMLSDNATKTQIEQALEQVCNFLPASVKDHCDTLVQQYTPQLISLLLNFKPQQVCTRLGLCTNSTRVQMKKVADGPQCVLCEFVVTQLDNMLSDNATQTQIEQALEQVCNFLPASIKDQCDTLVQQYTPQLISLLLNFKPQQVCTRLRLCTNSTRVQMKKVADGPQCVLCEFVVTQLDNMLSDNATQTQIEQALEQVCNFLPASIKDQCDTLVQQYTPQLISLLLNFKPQQVCTRLGLCTNSTRVQMKKVADGPQCVLCEFVVTQLDNMLSDNATQTQIEQALEQVCNFLPASIKDQCDTLVQQYTPQLISLLLNFKPQQVCTRLRLCTNSTRVQMKKVADGPQCVLCEFVVTQLDNMLSDNATQTQIEQALEQVCNFLPASIKDQCDTLVQQYTPQLISLLLNFKPQQVCTRLRLCTNSTRVQMKKVADGPQCVLCEFVVTQLDNMLSDNATQTQIEQALEQVCNFLPASIKDQCDTLVQQYTPQLISLLLNFKPQQVCTRLGLCTNSTRVQMKKVADGPQCVLCEFVVTQLDNMLSDNATQTQIEQALEQVCNFLPASIKDQCDTLVQQYTPQLISLLLNFKPQQVCTRLRLCTNSTRVQMKKVADGPQCVLCEFVVTQLDNMLSDNATQTQIEQALEQVCNFLPASIKDQCDTLVQQYTPQLISLLLNFKPQQVCTRLGLCTNSTRVQMKKVADGPQCVLCEFVVTQLDNMLSDNATQTQIEQALEQVCNFLPASIKDQCDTLVQQYTPQLISLLLNFKPQQVCTRLRLCTNSTRVQMKKVADGPQCVLCEFVVTQLDNMLSDNATQTQIEQALEQVCNFLPASIKDQCDTLVQQYTPQLISLLLNFKPQQVCTRLGLCTNSTRVQMKKVADGPQCVLCEFVVTQLDNMLSDNATQTQIEQALEQVCNFLPASIKDQCDTLVQQYTPQLISLLLNFKPQQVCTRLGLCTNSTRAQVSKVTDGPYCTICEFVLTELDNVLSDNATKAQIEQALEQVCNFLPASVKEQCDSLVQQYTPQLIALLLQFKPEEVCTRLNLCTSETQELKSNGPVCVLCEFVMMQLDNILAENATEAQIEMALEIVCNLLPNSVEKECAALVEQYTPQLIKMLLQFKPEEICTRLNLCNNSRTAKPKSNGPLCIICEFVIYELDNLLAENSTQAQIELALEIVCNLVPESVKHECAILVEQYSPQLIQLLLRFKPQEVCTRLSLCTASNLLDSSAECYFCEFIMTELENLITSTSGEAEIEAALKEVCILIPPGLQENCRYAVEDFTPGILNFLLSKVSPDSVCVSLKACPAPTEETPAVEEISLTSGSDLCEFCEYVIQYLDDVLEENITREEIEAAVHKLCSFVPQDVKDLCDQFLEEQAAKLIDQLEKTLDPKGLCKTAGLCNDHSLAVSGLSNLPKVEAYEFCVFCERLIPELDRLLQQDFTQEAIEAALHEVCKMFDGKALESCENFVTEYTPIMIEVLVTVTPDELCETLKLCPAKPEPTPAIQQSKSLQFVPESDQSHSLTALDRPIKYHPRCSTCKFLMYYLQTSITDSFWRDITKSSFYEFCHQIKYEQDVCKILMDMNADHLLGTIGGFRFPQTFCQSSDMCEPPFNDDDLSDHPFSKQLMPQVGAGDDFPHCDSCKFLASNLNQVASQPFWQAQVRTSLDESCDLMTYGKDVCKRLIEQNIQYIITNVSSAGWPDHICQAIHLCGMPSKKVLTTGEIACQLCGKISETANVFLKSGTSPKRVYDYLEMACSTNTDAVEKDRCLTIVRQYAPELFETLKTESPKAACKTMDVCFDN